MKIRYVMTVLAGLLVAGCSGDGRVPADEIPTITAIADQNTTANEQSTVITFTVMDEELASLSISVSSDNQQVIPDSGLALGGNGADRTLTVTPTIDVLGDAFITIIVSDPLGQTAGTSFLLTVVPQQQSLQQWTRAVFLEDEADDPELINAISFAQDADDDDFADFLAQ
jgi:hypothetical protein